MKQKKKRKKRQLSSDKPNSGFIVTTPLPVSALSDQPQPTIAKREEVNLDETQTFQMLGSGPLINTQTSVSPHHHLFYKTRIHRLNP